MFLLRRAQIHVLNSLVASQLGCHMVSKLEGVKWFIFSHKPAFPTLPISVNGATTIQSLDPGLLLEPPSPSIP